MGLVVLLEAFWGHFIDLKRFLINENKIDSPCRQMAFLFWCWSLTHSDLPLVALPWISVRVVGVLGLVHIFSAFYLWDYRHFMSVVQTVPVSTSLAHDKDRPRFMH
jgi:hypothetical protein